MSKVYSRNFYTNPFRYRSFDNKIDQAEVLEEVEYTLEPFLNEKFPLIKDYIDELGNIKSEAKIIQLIKEKLNFLKSEVKIIRFIKEQLNSVSKNFNFSLNDLETYNTNLRYLELPLHPMVDKNGFEVQMLSNELIDDAIDDMEDGFSYVYDYCSKTLPETLDLWYDYADFSQVETPIIAQDIALDETFETIEELLIDFYKSQQKEPNNLINLKNLKTLVKRIIDRDFNANQEDLKNLIKRTIAQDVSTDHEDSKDLIKWIVTADLNTNLLKIFKPTFKQEILDCLIIILKSLFCLLLFLQIMRTLLKSYFLSNIKEKAKEEIVEIYNNIFKIQKSEVKPKKNPKLKTNSMCFKKIGDKWTYIRRVNSNLDIAEPDVDMTTWDFMKEQNQKINSRLFHFRHKLKQKLLKFIVKMQNL
uniref:Uncharacterized protein n=1 Tax=Trachydiscus minutus TaxID=1032745 RepID=A0A0D3M5K0_9STRA|nr:hypothetical protein [Trachydiscus minutus]AIB04135.1 hypothetical protein [Trachydiscus minutus]